MAMLQQDLIGPLAVDSRKLLLGLDTVVIDAEKLALRSPALEAGELTYFVRCGA